MIENRGLFPVAVAMLAASSRLLAAAAEPGPKVDYNRDVRPILSENCFECLGPDEKARATAGSEANNNWQRTQVAPSVLPRLEKAGLCPSPGAGKEALLRRLSLDLIGLPPSPKELDAFLADTSPDAYDKQVERLLASP